MRFQARFRSVFEIETHVGEGVREHVWKVCKRNLRYDVSAKHIEGNLHAICAADSLSMTLIGALQTGHNQAECVAGVSS